MCSTMKMTPQLLALLTLGAASVNIVSACGDDAEGEPVSQRDAVEVREDAGAQRADAATADAAVAPESDQLDPASDGCPACGLG
jgi:hypothetical protein